MESWAKIHKTGFIFINIFYSPESQPHPISSTLSSSLSSSSLPNTGLTIGICITVAGITVTGLVIIIIICYRKKMKVPPDAGERPYDTPDNTTVEEHMYITDITTGVLLYSILINYSLIMLCWPVQNIIFSLTHGHTTCQAILLTLNPEGAWYHFPQLGDLGCLQLTWTTNLTNDR